MEDFKDFTSLFLPVLSNPFRENNPYTSLCKPHKSILKGVAYFDPFKIVKRYMVMTEGLKKYDDAYSDFYWVRHGLVNFSKDDEAKFFIEEVTGAPYQENADWPLLSYQKEAERMYQELYTLRQVNAILNKISIKCSVSIQELKNLSREEEARALIFLIKNCIFYPGGPFSYLKAEHEEKLSEVVSRVEGGKCDKNDFEFLDSLYSSFRNIVCILHVAHREIEDLLEFIPKSLSHKKILLPNGDINFKVINKTLESEFGRVFKSNIVEVGLLIVEFITSIGSKLNVPRANTSDIGLEFEYEVAKIYKSIGYLVEETAVTGDFGIDLILHSNVKKIGVQCKNLHSEAGVDAVMQAHSGSVYYGCNHSVVISRNGFTRAAKEMADRINVELLVFNGFLHPLN